MRKRVPYSRCKNLGIEMRANVLIISRTSLVPKTTLVSSILGSGPSAAMVECDLRDLRVDYPIFRRRSPFEAP